MAQPVKSGPAAWFQTPKSRTTIRFPSALVKSLPFALTRAQKRLHLTYCASRRRMGSVVLISAGESDVNTTKSFRNIERVRAVLSPAQIGALMNDATTALGGSAVCWRGIELWRLHPMRPPSNPTATKSRSASKGSDLKSPALTAVPFDDTTTSALQAQAAAFFAALGIVNT